MKSHLTAEFRRLFAQLPEAVQRRARQSYVLWTENPDHPGLHFKRVHTIQPIYSVRIAIGWRALGIRQGDAMVWFGIGSHSDYEALLKRL